MELVVASNNGGKISEIKQILAPFGISVLSQSEVGCFLNPEETGTSFEENARIKAHSLFGACKKAVIADDSGLEVDYLGKAPGVYSARYAGENATDTDRCRKLLCALEGVRTEQRTARFVCVIHFIDAQGREYSLRGECEGRIGTVLIGNNGFGYDPIFMLGEKSMAQLTHEEKNRISHRSKAISKLVQLLNTLENKGE